MVNLKAFAGAFLTDRRSTRKDGGENMTRSLTAKLRSGLIQQFFTPHIDIGDFAGGIA